jgi:hypothetical protein
MCVACVAWRVVFGFWLEWCVVSCGVCFGVGCNMTWRVESGVWDVVPGIWRVTCGACDSRRGVWCVACGAWCLLGGV